MSCKHDMWTIVGCAFCDLEAAEARADKAERERDEARRCSEHNAAEVDKATERLAAERSDRQREREAAAAAERAIAEAHAAERTAHEATRRDLLDCCALRKAANDRAERSEERAVEAERDATTWENRCEQLSELVTSTERERDEARADLAKHEADLKAAAGECLVPVPDPGTDMARLLKANRLLKAEVAREREAADRNLRRAEKAEERAEEAEAELASREKRTLVWIALDKEGGRVDMYADDGDRVRFEGSFGSEKFALANTEIRVKVAKLLREPPRDDEVEFAGSAVTAWRAYHEARDRAEAAERERDRLARILGSVVAYHGKFTDDGHDAECSLCAAMHCEGGEPLHYHHDGCPWEYVLERERDEARVEKDALRAKVEAQRPVVEAARALAAMPHGYGLRPEGHALIVAVRALAAKEGKS